MNIIVEINKSIRVDKYLTDLDIDGIRSRNHLDSLIKDGLVLVNGLKIKKSYLVENGDEIEINFPEKKLIDIEPEQIPLNIIYEDEYLLLVNKPANMVVHPAPGVHSGTLVNALVNYLGTKLSQADPSRPGIVHRLDKDTTGILLIAKDENTHVKLSNLFRERKIEKHYKAICVRVPENESGSIVTNIDRSRSDRKKMIAAKVGKEAITHYTIEEYFDYFALLNVRIETGRTHQIRVHFSHIQCPILGDMTYNSIKRTNQYLPQHLHKKMKNLLANHLTRQALHAYKLSFEHPITGKLLEFNAPLPADFEYTLNFLRRNFVTDLTQT